MPASSDETVVGPFFHPNSPLYLWLPIPCSNIWLFLPLFRLHCPGWPWTRFVSENKLGFLILWEGEHVAEKSWRRRVRKKCLQTPLTSYGATSGAWCICCHLVLQRAVTEREGSSWTRGWETLRGLVLHITFRSEQTLPSHCALQWAVLPNNFPHFTWRLQYCRTWTPEALAGNVMPSRWCACTLWSLPSPLGYLFLGPSHKFPYQTPWLDCKTHTRAVFPLGSWGRRRGDDSVRRTGNCSIRKWQMVEDVHSSTVCKSQRCDSRSRKTQSLSNNEGSGKLSQKWLGARGRGHNY